jgi:hypothetical protein
MKLHAVTIVRNEADIIEAFVRHTLAYVDALTVVNHGSFDETGEILDRLAAEGLPLTVMLDERAGFFQPEVLTPLVRDAIERRAADFVFVLDADEFIKTSSRTDLQAMLARIPSGMHGLVPWLTYAPDFDATSRRDPLRMLRSCRRVVGTREPLHKVVVARCFMQTPSAFVAMGNHRVFPSDEAPDQPCPHARLPPEALALAHVPIRSAEQLEAKITVGWLAHLAAARGNASLSFHWGEAYALLASGRRFSTEDLLAMAANYSVARAEWMAPEAIEWAEDPFLADIALRYSVDTQVDAFTLVLRFAERLARE